MKALTLQQPWASFVARGVKTIESRSWNTKYRGPLAIHAGASWSPHWLEWMSPDDWRCNALDEINVDLEEDCNGSGWYRPHWRDLPHQAVIATCMLTDVVPMVRFLSKGPGDEPEPPWEPWDGPTPPMPMLSLNNDATRASTHRPYRDVTDQLPYGEFAPGRWAWLLTDIGPFAEPVPASGRQGLWEWTP